MKKYQQLAEQLREQIASGIWQPGDRLPSLRDQVALSGMSFMTVSHAYQLLESQGYIIARPQSGYYVAPQAIKCRKRQSFQSLEMKQSISTLIFLICCRPVAIRRSFRLPRPFPTRDFSPPTTKPLAGAGKQNRHSDERD